MNLLLVSCVQKFFSRKADSAPGELSVPIVSGESAVKIVQEKASESRGVSIRHPNALSAYHFDDEQLLTTHKNRMHDVTFRLS